MRRLIIQIIVWTIVVMLVLSFLALLFVSAQAQPIYLSSTNAQA